MPFENATDWSRLLGSGLKFIFRWIAQFRSLFNLIVDVIILRTAAKSDLSSAKSLTFVVKSSEKTLILIKNGNGTSADLWGTPTSILVHEEYCPFKKTLSFLKFEKSVMMSNSS